MGGRLTALSNIAKAWLLLGGFVALFSALGWWLGGLGLASVCLIVTLIMAGTVFWYGPRVLLASLGARELPLSELPSLHGTVERLAHAAGVERPKLYVVPDGHPRALSVGRGAGSTAIVLTEGLVGMARPAELEGVVAHEVAHARNRDVTIQTPVVLIAGLLVETSRIGGFLQRALLFVLGPIAAGIVHAFLSPGRELAADALAAGICGTPHSLADALVHLEQAQELIAFQGNPTTEPLYTIDPFEKEGLAAYFATHPPVAERVRRLREMDPDWRERLRAA